MGRLRINRRAVLAISALVSVLFFIKLAHDRSPAYEEKAAFSGPRQLGKAKAVIAHENEFQSDADTCYYDSDCASPQILFRLHAETLNAPPFACLNDINLFDAKTLNKGLNLASLNGTTGDIISTVVFDVSSSDANMIAWLRNLPDSVVLVGVSFGDFAERLSSDARHALELYGAERIKEWSSGSAYAILGQRGLAKGKAMEMIVNQTAAGASGTHLKEGCFDLPLGDLLSVNLTDSSSSLQRVDEARLANLGGKGSQHKKKVTLGEEFANCGMDTGCSPDTIAMYFYSGASKDDTLKMCIDGRMVFDRDLNDAGRGLNLVSIEPKTGRITDVKRFDTYADESPGLEDWLENVASEDLVAVVSFDEASTMLSSMAKKIFYEMGSSMIDRLRFRGSWYFIGQKRISAYTPFEDLNIPSGNQWAKPIKTAICVPRSTSNWFKAGSPKLPVVLKTSSTYRNYAKRHFCLRYDRHDDFCKDTQLDELIAAKRLSDPVRSKDPVFNMPILVVAGLQSNMLRSQLQALMKQEGLNTQMVLVAYDKEYDESEALASLFHVKSVPINATDSYNNGLLSAINVAFDLFPSADALAVLEEEVIPTSDWLQFAERTLPVLKADERVDLIQMLNPSGFSDTSGSLSSVYRSSFQPPLLSYILTRRVYEKYLFNTSSGCCKASSFGRWRLGSAYALVPDVSRVIVSRPQVLFAEYTRSDAELLYARTRLSSDDIKETTPSYSSAAGSVGSDDFLTESAYDAALHARIASAAAVSLDGITCSGWQKQLEDLARVQKTRSIVISTPEDVASLSQAAACFKLYFDEKFVTGTYKRILRFNHAGVDVFIIPRGSSFERI